MEPCRCRADAHASDRVVAVRTIYAGRSMVRMCIRPSAFAENAEREQLRAGKDRHDRGQKREPGDRRTAQQEAPNDEGQHPESEQREGEADEGCQLQRIKLNPVMRFMHGGRAIGTDSSTRPTGADRCERERAAKFVVAQGSTSIDSSGLRYSSNAGLTVRRKAGTR